MDVHIPTHVSLAVGNALLRAIVTDLNKCDSGRNILEKLQTGVVYTSEDTKSVTLDSLLDTILPRDGDSDSSDDSDSVSSSCSSSPACGTP